MSWKNIATVYGKELRDLLRDRRTMISMIVVPTFVMPGLMAVVVFTMVKMQREVAASTPTIMVVGDDDGSRARAELLAYPGIKIQPFTAAWKDLISDKKLGAAVEIPRGFDVALQKGESATVTIYRYETEPRSQRAADELQRFFDAYSARVVTARLAERGLPATTIRPFKIERLNVVGRAKVGANVIGGMIPYFFLILSFTGAMYPAMDLTAGEKERGTMETILCSPVPRVDIVLGKFLTILTVSLATVACSLVSMAVTFMVGGAWVARMVGGNAAAAQRAAEKFSTMTTLDPVGMVAVVALILPMVVLFSAFLFAISLFAKSFKEAQSYVSPLIIVIIMPAMLGMLPGMNLSTKVAFIPVLNVSLASKELVSGTWHWGLLGLIFGSSCLYAGIALVLAVKMFNRESVIFRT